MSKKNNKTTTESEPQGENSGAQAPEAQVSLPQVKKHISGKLVKLVACGLVGGAGIGCMVVYFFTSNMLLGYLGVFVAIAGGVGFYFSFKEQTPLVAFHIGKKTKKQVNSLTLYPDEIVFDDFYFKEDSNDGGFLWTCDNDGKQYYVLWEDTVDKKIKPFILPDQQYCDPEVFAQRYLTLPCHRKILKRKEPLLTKLRPVFLIIGIVLVWLLIMTTTGQQGEEVAWCIPPILNA